MINKKTILLIVISIIVITVLITLYFKYWYEPKATYVETDSPKLTQIRQDLKEYIAELRKKGEYRCCIRNDCVWCAIYMGHCYCQDLVMEKGNEKSCPECAAAWNRKLGRFPGIDPNAIEVTTFGIYGYEESGHHHPDYEGSEEEAKPMHHQEEEHHH